MATHRAPDHFNYIFMTSLFIIEAFMGREWTKRVFLKRTGFLVPRFNGKAFNPGEAMMRAIELAEALLNLQSNTGFCNVIKRIRTDSLEPEMAALLIAKLLFVNGHSFRFVEPVGQARQDYDLEITLNSVRIACEVKCKLEATAKSYETVLGTLKKAAIKQLPVNMPSIIFVHLPSNWTDNLSWVELLDRAAIELFRVQKRVNGVFAISYQRFYGDSTDSTTVRFSKAFIHPAPRNLAPDLDRLFQSDWRPNVWSTVAELCGYFVGIKVKN